MKLTEYNLITYIEKLLPYQPVNDIFMGIKKQVDIQESDNQYSSLKANYLAIFVYTLIKNKIPLKEYESLLKTIFKKEKTVYIGNMMSHLLGDNPEIQLSFYLKEGKYNHEKYFWGAIGYVFFNMENGKRVLDRENLPYLISLFKHFPENHISALYEGKIFTLFYSFSNQLEEIIPLLNTVQENPALSMRDIQYYKGIVGTLLYALSSISYEKTDEENKKNYQFCVKHIPHIQKNIEIELVKPQISNPNKWEVKLDLLNFLLSVDIDVFSILNNKFLSLYKENISTVVIDENKQYEKINEKFEEVMRYFNSTLSVAVEKDFILDLNLIDVSKNLYNNWLYLKGLELKIEKGYSVEISPQLHDYLMSHLKLVEEESKKDHYPVKMKIGLDHQKIITFLNFDQLNKTLDNKNINKTQLKI